MRDIVPVSINRLKEPIRMTQRITATLAAVLLLAGISLAGSLDPTNAPGPTMHTLEEIYQKVSWLSSSVLEITTLTNPVTVFSAAIPKTGQTNSYAPGDDGTYQKGMLWPNPRFTIGDRIASNCVLDNLTGLMWIRNPDALAKNWTNAIDYCNALDGADGRGGHIDWRMPNKKELESLLLCQFFGPPLPNTEGTAQWEEGDPFIGIQSYDSYWSSTAYAPFTGAAWAISLYDGASENINITAPRYAWPVRNGQLASSYSSTNTSTGGQINILNETKGTIPSSSFTGLCSITPVKPGSFHLFISGGTDGQFTDDGSGRINGTFNIGGVGFPASGTINYDNGAYGINLGVIGSEVVGKTVTISYIALTSSATSAGFIPPLEEINANFTGGSISFTTDFVPLKPGSITVSFADGANGSVTDDGAGNFTGTYLNAIPGSHPANGTINYSNGQIAIFFPDVLGLQNSRVTIRYTVAPGG